MEKEENKGEEEVRRRGREERVLELMVGQDESIIRDSA